MPKYEEWMENREDVFFALLVEKSMDADGKGYLAFNKELKKNPEGIVPHGAYKRGLRTIDRAFRKQWRQTAGGVTAKILTRIAVAVCCLVVLLATALAVSPAVRDQVYALVKEIRWDSTELILTGDALAEEGMNLETVSVYNYSEPVLPEGFELVEERGGEDWRWYYYGNGEGSHIQIMILQAKPSLSHGVDTEKADLVKPIAYGSFEGLYVEKGGFHSLFLADVSYGCYITIVGERVDGEALLSVMEDLHYIE